MYGVKELLSEAGRHHATYLYLLNLDAFQAAFLHGQARIDKNLIQLYLTC